MRRPWIVSVVLVGLAACAASPVATSPRPVEVKVVVLAMFEIVARWLFYRDHMPPLLP